MAEVHYTEPALLDLDNIERFIISRSDVDTATNFIYELSETFHLLAEMPTMGRVRNDLQQGLRMFVHRRYVILYSEIDEGVLIERVAPPYRNIEKCSRMIRREELRLATVFQHLLLQKTES